ncbi:MAG: restriction endonuclease subunit S [Synergistes sp.]|nr:restriction endonuclease subunit S [Synergistes sp.]
MILGKTSLGPIIEIKKGSYITKKEEKEGPYPVILGGQEPAYYINRYNHTGKAIVISRSGASAGYVSRWNEPIFVTDGFLINPKNDVDFDFLYYLLKYHQPQLQGLQGGAAIPHVNPRIINAIEVFLPSMPAQKNIVAILSAYDDLIENNQKQIKLLEEVAQRLYKEWFVDLRFPGYEDTPVVNGVPEGWTICYLDDVIEFNPKISLNKERVKQCVPMAALSTQSMILDSSEFIETTSNSGSKFQNGDTLLARITPCLENGKTGFVSGLISDEGAVGSTEFIVMRSKKLNKYMVYLLARTSDFRMTAINSMTGSDGRQRAQIEKIRKFTYLLPPASIIGCFEEISKPLFEAIHVRSRQNKGLAHARDRLLPKLMSGEIEV